MSLLGVPQFGVELAKHLEREAANRKEEWISQYIFMAGEKWTDKPISREEAERVWDENHGISDAIITCAESDL